tara:strand:+ start:4080 stop:4280 length:201 start_codon:yes stop_codon:yes gene_type:complete
MKFNVPEMSCGHCTSSIEKAIKQADSAASVTCDIPGRTVAVQSGLASEKLAEVLKQAGYDSTPVAA